MSRVALSASFWNNPKVNELLKSCDAIYTTQVKNYKKLCNEFGEDKIFIIPLNTPSMSSLIKEWYAIGTEFVEYKDLFELQYNISDDIKD